MKSRSQIEAALEQSLRRQVKVPALDNRFDAKVWARIAAEEQPAQVLVPASRAVVKAGRWLNILNIAGLAGSAIFVSFFVARMFSGIDLTVTMPEIAPTVGAGVAAPLSLGIAGAAILFGFWNTPWIRRLRDEFI